MKVSFIGLGGMGKGMAHRIQVGGHELTVFDVVGEATTEFAAAGARVADSDVCKGNDVVLTMLVEDSAVIDVVLRRGRSIFAGT
jgi:3-hydroxyisobutyrate dehydrogenase